jgi:hypothetical protein
MSALLFCENEIKFDDSTSPDDNEDGKTIPVDPSRTHRVNHSLPPSTSAVTVRVTKWVRRLTKSTSDEIRWQARPWFGNRHVNLGVYDTKSEATAVIGRWIASGGKWRPEHLLPQWVCVASEVLGGGENVEAVRNPGSVRTPRYVVWFPRKTMAMGIGPLAWELPESLYFFDSPAAAFLAAVETVVDVLGMFARDYLPRDPWHVELLPKEKRYLLDGIGGSMRKTGGPRRRRKETPAVTGEEQPLTARHGTHRKSRESRVSTGSDLFSAVDLAVAYNVTTNEDSESA